jgi:putative ubiquitin-RnfH superfamily antitoxin RatB of RatAB toxin-antitoxin module
MADAARVHVTVLHALPERQLTVELDLPQGATAADAVIASGLLGAARRSSEDIGPLGLFGRVVPSDYQVSHGDRIELLRPLKNDPRETRRRLAAEGRSMGRRR